MEPALKRATVYLDPQLHKALKLKSIETSTSISALVNQAVKDALAEDASDITTFEATQVMAASGRGQGPSPTSP